MRCTTFVMLIAVNFPNVADAAAARVADPISVSQRRMATGLAVAHVRAQSRKFPQATLPGVDFDHPQVVDRQSKSGQRWIFVSFESKLTRSGEYVTFEVCAHTSRVVRVAAGRSNDIRVYQNTVKANKNLPRSCK